MAICTCCRSSTAVTAAEGRFVCRACADAITLGADVAEADHFVALAKIRALRKEAAFAGDAAQVHLCDLAIRGDWDSVEVCHRVLVEAI